MGKIFSTIKENSVSIYRVLIFLTAIAIVVYILPREGKFPYEYSKGKPWKHEMLIAPFDFPVYKSQQELQKERDSILANFRPYFVFDTLKGIEQIHRALLDIENKKEELTKNYPFLEQQTKGNDSTVWYLLKNTLERELTSVYSKGLIHLPETYEDADDAFELILIRNNFAEPSGLSEFHNYQRAYQQISLMLFRQLRDASDVEDIRLDNLISDLQLNKYLEPNIKYDAERTSREREAVLKNISLTSGVVLSGQKIIDTGEIVDEKTAKILDSLKKEYESSLGGGSGYYFILLGQVLLTFLFLTMIYLFLFYFRRDVYNNLLSITFILLMFIGMLLLVRLSRLFEFFPLYIIPFAILPIIIRTFFESRLAFFMHVITILMAAFFTRNSFEFVYMEVPVGLIAIFSLFRMVRREQLVRTSIFIVLTYSAFYSALAILQEGNLKNIDISLYGQFLINGALVFLAYPLIYIFEKAFGFISDVTLVELSDTNHPLLRRLAEKAPGSFQHSLQVGNLAQEAVYKIGGNPLLVRAGAMYHDIGKIVSPIFFTENQNTGFNPHANLDLEKSAQSIIQHIENGVKIARKHKLPEQIIDFIRTHQGTTKARFFYNSYKNEHPGEEPDETKFTYPGPTPFTKETAILMMADAVEAASRSLKTFSDEEIEKVVENIINSQIEENQFVNAPITFREITQVKEVFKQKLKNIYHARIEYPEVKSEVKTSEHNEPQTPPDKPDE
ncbi:MAG: cyclic-di-AMP phosphodiesterase PgpH [Anaerophaga sp.]|uniref:HD family phosphohydrolase n=1 Tax=Anaerophaga thermohalophila TaxID=177400 RepID=UPI000237C20B|nr:HDIG domain-containing metalloprotein [Anaerophaga thermohalophila]MDK2842496.1 cyclic-di-AMP phosphodiesterase PgpH [Anaerophaga sp.]MDN5291897.1 cyclic-di-AMP phosphodiesterase PgpH [Anaerophaga sp.]